MRQNRPSRRQPTSRAGVLGWSFGGAVLSQTSLAKRTARLIDKALSAAAWAVLLVVLLVYRWFAGLPYGVRVLVGLVLLGLLLGWAYRSAGRLGQARRDSRARRLLDQLRVDVSPVPVLAPDEAQRLANLRACYVYLEDEDLEPGHFCLCGIERVAGAAVYVGKSKRGDDVRHGEHTDDKHWLMLDPPVTRKIVRTGFGSDLELAQAERDAYFQYQPRENRKVPSLTGT